jgi:hypothetical protein
MIPLLVGAAIGAGLGILQSIQKEKADKAAREEQRRYNMYAPIFGQAPKPLGAAYNGQAGDIIGGGLTGAGMGQNFMQSQALMKLLGQGGNGGGDTTTPQSTGPIAQYETPGAPPAQQPNFYNYMQ